MCPPETRAGERGSAYIVALLALVVLSILGLGLALITQTEMQIGAAEVTQQRALYAADSGISRATARAIGKYDCNAIPGTDFVMVDQDLTTAMASSNLREEIATSPTLPILEAPCNLCMVNAAGGSQQEGKQSYFQITHALSAEATRFRGTSTEPLAVRAVSSFFTLEPFPKLGDCWALASSPEAEKVRM
jgi:hypothetical protein